MTTDSYTEDIFEQPEFIVAANAGKRQRNAVLKSLNTLSPYMDDVVKYYLRMNALKHDSTNGPVMTWGKYKGLYIKDVPESYIKWMNGPQSNVPEKCRVYVTRKWREGNIEQDAQSD